MGNSVDECIKKQVWIQKRLPTVVKEAMCDPTPKRFKKLTLSEWHKLHKEILLADVQGSSEKEVTRALQSATGVERMRRLREQAKPSSASPSTSSFEQTVDVAARLNALADAISLAPSIKAFVGKLTRRDLNILAIALDIADISGSRSDLEKKILNRSRGKKIVLAAAGGLSALLAGGFLYAHARGTK